MSANYTLNLNNEETKTILKGILKDKCPDAAFDGVTFLSAEFNDSDPACPVTIKVRLDNPAPAVLFAALQKHIEAQVKRSAKYKFEFSAGILPAQRLSLYWPFFGGEMPSIKPWLIHTVAALDKGSIILVCDQDFIRDKLLLDKTTQKIPVMAREFFGIEAVKLEILSVEKADEEGQAIVRGSIEAIKQESTGSETLKDDEIKGEPVPIENIAVEGKFLVEGRIFHSDDYIRELRPLPGKPKTYMIFFYITNEKDTIKAVVFAHDGDSLLSEIDSITHVRALIETRYDEREGEITARVKKMQKISKLPSKDEAAEKRIELHAHTVMSAMDSVMPVQDYIKTAAAWGHEAVAITDHGVVHAFPEAYNCVIKNKLNIKLILGVEGYLVDRFDEKDKSNNKEIEQYHIIILVKNREGLKNLYRLVSGAHMRTF